MNYLAKVADIFKAIPIRFVAALSCIGVWYTLRHIKTAVCGLYTHCIQPSLNFKERYGPDSWALVTGGASGIGKAWVEELAKRGFKIIILDIIDASELKSQIEKDYKVEVMALECNLNDQDSIEQLAFRLKGYNISILVSNAGINSHGQFIDKSPDDLMKLINLNIIGSTLIIKTLLPMLIHRENRSAIIVMSSRSAVASFPYASVYAGTKAYLRNFCMSLNEEVKDKIDILCVQPAIVSSPMTGNLKTGGIIVSAKDCVEAAIMSLGRRLETVGALRHALLDWSISHLTVEEKASFTANMMRSQFNKKK